MLKSQWHYFKMYLAVAHVAALFILFHKPKILFTPMYIFATNNTFVNSVRGCQTLTGPSIPTQLTNHVCSQILYVFVNTMLARFLKHFST